MKPIKGTSPSDTHSTSRLEETDISVLHDRSSNRPSFFQPVWFRDDSSADKMRMILLLVQLATCCAIGSAVKCHECSLVGSDFNNWDWTTKCTLTANDCPAGQQCFITKVSGAYQVGCKADCKGDANTKCCNNTDGCNKWLDVSKDAPAWKKLEDIKAACSPSNKDLKACVKAISSTKSLKCYSCSTDLGADYFTPTSWDLTTKCPLSTNDCPAGDQCSITKVSGAVTYKMGCKPACEDNDDTKCCDSDGCNNWLDVADANDRNDVKTVCNEANNNVKKCVEAVIKTKTPKCYSCSAPLGVNYFTPSGWDWSAQCTLTPCGKGQQCSITKDSGAGTYQVGCKATDDCKDANTKCCDADGCNNWLDVSKDADAWKKVEAIKDACSPSNKDLKACLKAIDPTISGGGGLAGGLGLPLVLAISVIVLVVLG
ncbi:extracellular matrix protein A-like [Dunckerocampus dactyliophorus]|uniref:extracellular matrix protein A-like n=1 Tax=Dunckerocampus dactyliophorus TaxID=161453 RepID=UPI002404AF08|nr:extracellular matrix protein A-like [Dunckerocampus dactyliophorus]